MCWRKLVDHNPQFVTFCDKLATKDYFDTTCPDLLYPRTLWIGKDSDAIPDELLYRDVFVKANHGWRMQYRPRRKLRTRKRLKKKTDRWLNKIHGRKSHQWAYSMVEPMLFVEEALGDPGFELVEFNVRACDGKVILGSAMGGNLTPDRWVAYLDEAGRPVAGLSHEPGDPIPQVPEGIEIVEPYLRALDFGRRLSAGVDYARFDFFWDGKNLYGGEITIYPSAGRADILDPDVHEVVLTGWDLLKSHCLTAKHSGFKQIYVDALRRRLMSPG
jgi:hypothetical protein